MNIQKRKPNPGTLSRSWLHGVLAAASLGLAACASSTTISSQPPGAQVTVQGQARGQTPYLHQEGSVWVWTSTPITLRKDGYMPLSASLEAEAEVWRIICGVCCFPLGLPVALAGKYPQQYNYVLTPIRDSSPSAPMEPPRAPAPESPEGVEPPTPSKEGEPPSERPPTKIHHVSQDRGDAIIELRFVE